MSAFLTEAIVVDQFLYCSRPVLISLDFNSQIPWFDVPGVFYQSKNDTLILPFHLPF